jgi:hypothetical protein
MVISKFVFAVYLLQMQGLDECLLVIVPLQ